jgi:glycosyltransferase involved in cell wall biosynthesis
MKKVLINFVTIYREGFMVLWLLKLRKLQELGLDLYINGAFFVKRIDLVNGDIYSFNDKFEEIKKIPEIKLTKFGYIRYSIKRNYKALKNYKRIFKGTFDIIYSPSSVLDLVLFPFIAKILGKKIKWATVFDNTVPFTDPGNKIIRFLAWLFFQISVFLIRKADVVFVSTPELMEYLIKRNFDKNKLVQTNFAIEGDLIKQAKPDERFNIDMLFIGRINETKGIYDMLKALKIIKKKYPDFQFAIMGRGDEVTERQFKNRIREMGLDKNIQFLGYRNGQEKFNIIKSSKCFWFLSVSKSESFGMALLEAVCSGLPAFVYDLEPFKRIYKNGEVFMFKKNDYESVAKKVIDVFDKNNFENKEGESLVDKYSWDRIAEIEYEKLKNL